MAFGFLERKLGTETKRTKGALRLEVAWTNSRERWRARGSTRGPETRGDMILGQALEVDLEWQRTCLSILRVRRFLLACGALAWSVCEAEKEGVLWWG